MPLTPVKHIPADAKTTIIEITSYEHGNPVGTLHNPALGRRISFHSTMELLSTIDEILNMLSFPQATMRTRTFMEIPARPPEEDPKWTAPPIETFKLNIVFRQNASWQGTLTWVGNEQQLSFRSALEMLKLMDSVMLASEQQQHSAQAGSM